MAIYLPKPNQKLQRYEIAAWEGCNTIVGDNLTKRGEPGFLENVRSNKIGWLDKRAGHSAFGEAIGATANYGLYEFINEFNILVRVSKVSNVVSIYSSFIPTPSASVSPSSSVSPSVSFSPSLSPSFSPSVSPSVSPSAVTSFSPSKSPSVSPSASPSLSLSSSISPSSSPSLSTSPSKSPSKSPSASPSVSLSPSKSPSVSPSVSVSPSPSTIWTQLSGSGTNLSAAQCDFASAFERCFITNGVDNNRYIESDGITVVDSSSTSGMLYNSPKARLVTFYKNQLYLGDYLNVDNSRERTGICWSSVPLGIVSLVSGDQPASLSTTVINVTDTQYIKVGSVVDYLDVWRGGVLIGTLTVDSKTQTTLGVEAYAFDLKSADQLWIQGTRNGAKKIRWDNRATGINVRTYDSQNNLSPENLTCLETVGNNLLAFTNNSITLFNGSAWRSLDLNIGCVARKSFVKILGQGIFAHYSGIYSTTGGTATLLSAKIQKIFDNADKANAANWCAAVDGFSYFLYIGTVPFYNSDGSLKKTLNNVVIELNLRQNNFFIHTDVPMDNFISYSRNGQLSLLFTNNEVYTYLSGLDDNGSAINFTMEQNDGSLGMNFESIFIPVEVSLNVKMGSQIQVFCGLDGKTPFPIGIAKTGLNRIPIDLDPRSDDFARCRLFKVVLREFSKSKVSIANLAVKYYLSSDVEDWRS